LGIKVLQAALLFGVYFAAARFGLKIDSVSGFATLVWAPTGIALAALWIGGARLWPAIALGAFLVNLESGASILPAAGIASGNTLEALIGVYLLRRNGFRPTFDSLRSALTFIFYAAILSAVISATIGVSSLWLGGVIPPEAVQETWRAWWIGDTLGALIVGPFILIWYANRNLNWSLNLKRIAEVMVLILGVGTIGSIVLGGGSVLHVSTSSVLYLAFPIITWVAFRLGVRATITTTSFIAVACIAATILGNGPFKADSLNESLALLHLFLGTFVVTALIMATVVEEKLQANRTLQAQKNTIERRTDQLDAANRAKDSWIATVSHELRTPMNVIGGWVEMLENGKVPSMELPSVYSILKRNVQTQSRLIEDLLDISSIITGKIRIKNEDVDLAPLIHDVIESMRLAAQAKKINLAVDVQPNLRMRGDNDRLRQIIFNLLSNAIKFTSEGGSIVVTGKKLPSSKIQLMIRDTGIGIAADFLPYVFDRLSQEDAKITRKFGGLGLGLAISRYFVELHGGTIEVASEGKDLGSTFTVTLNSLD
jgi:signal transduction histidine kinase